MPQMMPMNWCLLMLYFFMIILLVMILMSYIDYFKLNQKFEKKIKMYKFNFKW